MNMVMFYEWFPELSESEFLVISLCTEEAARYGLPPAQYFCQEHYCPNPDCNCGEARLIVIGDHFSGPLAGLSIDLAEGAKTPVEEARETAQSQYSTKLVRLLNDRLTREPSLLAQLRRHYGLIKKRAVRDVARQRFLSQV